ncbi:hypothetical protein DL95DRAFT_388074 [Leptodontidium sp. 2 PMI_412]|nr:hypothetical protein DL95DRAFT_388074 [Leptodontidium sp. 2 PMI_412]
MSNVSDAADAQRPFPSFEELKSAQTIIWKSPAGFRLFWSLDGPFPETISVMQDRHNPTSLTPYFSNGAWHPIAQEPISVPKISSITVGVDELDGWEDAWEDCHEAHGEMGDGQEGRWYGDLEDYEYDPQDEDRGNRLLGCCGEPRPRNKKVRIVVRPASGTFVTVHDYLSTLRPWLMGMKEDIRRSTDVWQCGLTDMMVESNGLNCLGVEEKSDWIRYASIVVNPTARQPELLSYFGPGFGPECMPDFGQLL